jgi:L-threonylcarbamoyladenylate synthase
MKKGDLIIVPTDTVYELATMLHDQEGLTKLYELNGSERSKQIPILVSKMSDLIGVVETTLLSRKIMKAFWPGPLTLVLRTTDEFYEKTGERTLSVRMPNHPIALNLLKTYGILRSVPLNQKSEQPIKEFKYIKDTYGPYVSEIHEQTYNQSTMSSSIVDLTGDAYVVLKEGNIKKEDLDIELKDFIDFLNKN